MAEVKERNQTFSGLVNKARVFVENALLPEIQGYLAPYGLNPAELARGRAMLDSARNLMEAGAVVRGEQLRMTQKVKEKGGELFDHLRLGQLAARAVLRERPDLLTALGMTPRRKRRKREGGEPLPPVFVSRSFATREAEAEAFYTNALASPEIIALLATRGYDTTRLNAGLTMLRDWMGLNSAQEKAKAMSQTATEDLKTARRDLARWYGDARMISRRALKERKDLYHALGLA